MRTANGIAQPHVHALTGAYVCHALDVGEARAFERHVAECPDCAVEVAELRETAALLAMTVVEAPPPRMHAVVMASIDIVRQLPPIRSVAAAPSTPAQDAEPGSRADADGLDGLDPNRRVLGHRVRGGFRARPTRPARPGRHDSRRVSRKLVAGWALAAVLAGVLGGLSVHEAAENRRLSQATSQSAEIAALLAAPDVRSGSSRMAGGGSVTVIDSRQRGQAEITLSDLPALPAGKAYQLWFIDSATMRSAGVVPAATASRTVLADGLGRATTIAITVEPATGSAQPTTSPILLMSVPA